MTKAARVHSTPPTITSETDDTQSSTLFAAIENPAAFVLPTGILKEDACIIDEQDDHLVLTLRVPKEVIRSNQPLLHALVEMSAPTWSPAEPEKGDLDDA